MMNNASNKPAIFALILLLSIFTIISTIAFSIPNSLTLQGKLTNLARASQQGAFNATKGTTSLRVTSDNNIVVHLE